MQTSSLVSLIKREAPSWSRELIRSLINDVQNIMLMKVPLKSTRILSSTGIDVKLTTISGTYEYYANSTGMPNIPTGVTAWKIAYVYGGTMGSETEVECMKLDGNYSNPAKIVFIDNPGVQDVYVVMYKNPTEVSSESIEMTVPTSYHLTHIYEGVMGFIEKTENGRSDRWVNFIERLCPQYWYEQNDDLDTLASSKYHGGY